MLRYNALTNVIIKITCHSLNEHDIRAWTYTPDIYMHCTSKPAVRISSQNPG